MRSTDDGGSGRTTHRFHILEHVCSRAPEGLRGQAEFPPFTRKGRAAYRYYITTAQSGRIVSARWALARS